MLFIKFYGTVDSEGNMYDDDTYTAEILLSQIESIVHYPEFIEVVTKSGHTYKCRIKSNDEKSSIKLYKKYMNQWTDYLTNPLSDPRTHHLAY